MAGGGAVRQNAARVQLAAQFNDNERRQEGYAYTYIFRGRNRGFQEAFRRIPRRRFDSTHNDSPCLRDEKRWESAKHNATSSTHNDSPCLRDEEPICRIQLCQSNTHNDSPCLRDEKRWESAMERSTACAVVPDPCCFQRAPFLQETLSRQRWTYSHSPTRSAG